MNRRKFLLSTGGAAVASFPLGHSLNALDTAVSTHSAIELTNGANRIAMVGGDRGYGIELLTRHSGVERRAAISPAPIGVFYGLRNSGNKTEVAFDHAGRHYESLTADISFKDTQSNQWQVDFVAKPCENSGFRCRFDYHLISGSASNVFFEHLFRPAVSASTDETYVLMPGLLYDGNRLIQATLQIPQLTAAEDFTVDTPVLTLSTPVAAFQDKQSGLTFMYVTGPTTDLNVDMSGFRCEASSEGLSIAVMAPCYREKHYHHDHYEPETPKGAYLTQGSSFSIEIAIFAGVYPDRLALFRALEPIRRFVRIPFRRTKSLPMSAAAELVQANLNARQWCEDGFYINAMEPD